VLSIEKDASPLSRGQQICLTFFTSVSKNNIAQCHFERSEKICRALIEAGISSQSESSLRAGELKHGYLDLQQ
jgi:hypothetical protein